MLRKRKKPVTKDHILYDSIILKSRIRKSIKTERRLVGVLRVGVKEAGSDKRY